MPKQLDTKFDTYLKAFFTDLLTGMSGPLSVPFAALAIWVSSRSQKVLWGCLAVTCATLASYRVWRKERIHTNAQIETKDAEAENLKREKDSQIADLNQRISELLRRPYSEDLENVAKCVLNQMTHSGHLWLRHLLMHEPIELGRPFIPGIDIEAQNQQMSIAYKGGIIRHDEKRQGAMVWTYFIVTPQFRPVLENILYEYLR